MIKKLLLITIIIIIISFFYIFIGPEFYSISELIKEPEVQNIFLKIRLPRLILGILAGASLAIAGTYMQVITKNEIASPSILGVVDGATLGVVVSFAFFPSAQIIFTSILSIIFSIITTLIIFIFTTKIKDGLSRTKLAIIGIIISSYIGAITTIVALSIGGKLSIDRFFLGGLTNTSLKEALLMLIIFVICIIPLIYFNKYMVYLKLEDDVINALGINTIVLKTSMLLLAVILSASAISLIGKVAFLGLIAPNIAKIIVKDKYGYLTAISATIGILLILIADIIAQLINYPYEVSLTVILTIIGVPYFFYLVFKRGV